MVARLRIEFTSTGTPDASLPFRDRDDPILTPGSVALLELGHPSASIGFAGVPGANAVIPNGAAKRMAALAGGAAGDYALLHSDRHTGTDAVFTRSDKGGFNRIYTQTNQTGNDRGSAFDFAAALKAFVFAHLDDDWYFSEWTRPTRAPVGNGTNEFAGILNNASTSNSLTQLQDAAPVPASGVAFLGADFDAATLGAPRFRSLGSRGFVGTKPAAAANLTTYLLAAGNVGPYASQSTNKAGSHVAYRAYLENLTLSGRTFEKVRQIDRGMFAAAFATGGRYAGDAYAAPSTFP